MNAEQPAATTALMSPLSCQGLLLHDEGSYTRFVVHHSLRTLLNILNLLLSTITSQEDCTHDR